LAISALKQHIEHEPRENILKGDYFLVYASYEITSLALVPLLDVQEASLTFIHPGSFIIGSKKPHFVMAAIVKDFTRVGADLRQNQRIIIV
jgi:hypothetical protein